MINTINREIDAFFDAYEKRFMDGLKGNVDIDGTTSAFAPCFVEASPAGVICGQNDDMFKEAIPKGYAFYKSIGTTTMKITGKEVTALDDFHYLCKVHWRATYDKAGKPETVIDFDVTYFLQRLKDTFKIFAYVTGDEQKVMKEYGVI